MDYRKLRDEYTPETIQAVFVLESPPRSGKYFYDAGGETTECLFRALMDVIGYTPATKEEGLREFQKRGFIVVDASYIPVNNYPSGSKVRNDKLLAEYPNLLRDLEHLIPQKDAPLILVKKNVFQILGLRLSQEGYAVVNTEVIPFPSHQWGRRFQEGCRRALSKHV